ncbi:MULTISPECIES: hypothetical protein [unclassified Moorena]|uniref:hypothetical protein n=1 Tax=unclassified Moorena TaxID=2683338 RepID=UPI0013B7AE14|nr:MULTISPECIES: hypothetical protein [unclassified Moorena]NEQ12370.1 hypothetical protein [Moorena sp. SIO4E2]NER91105.1 hypothetical protein [Moorena sp. SIO3A2]
MRSRESGIGNREQGTVQEQFRLTRWVEWASWWNGHLGGMGILVEWASCPLSIFVEWASWWNGHLGGMGILPVINICGMGILPVINIFGRTFPTSEEAKNQDEPVLSRSLRTRLANAKN